LKTNWTKDSALAELKTLAEQTHGLANQTRFCEDHMRWTAKALALLEEVFGPESRYYMTFANFTWRQDGQFLVGGPGDPEGSWNPGARIEKEHQKAYIRHLEAARGLLLAAADHLGRSDLHGVYEGKNTPQESSDIIKVIALAERNLRKIIRSRPEKEKEIQDSLENLLVGADIQYSREAERIEYSSKTYVPDFTLGKLDLAIDMKLCNRDGREKGIIAEINDDILAYKTKYANLLFIIYDNGFIRDTDRFSESFEKHQSVLIRVVKH
jgi:hypothetical protein